MVQSVFLALGVLFFWGLGNFVAKIASTLTGGKAFIWDRVGSLVMAGILMLVMGQKLFGGQTSISGSALGILVGLLTGIGTFLFYILLSTRTASWTVAITSVYPAVTVILAILFLSEKVGVREVVGIALSLIAVYLLSGG